MNVWNKVFLGVIFVTSIAVVALAAVEFHIRITGLRHVDTLKDRIAAAERTINEIRSGTAPTKLPVDKTQSELSFEELRRILLNLYAERGTVWYGSIVHDIDERTLPPDLQQVVAQVIITGPFVSGDMGIETNVALPEALRGIVYVFEEAVESNEENRVGHPSSFLGRFTVEDSPVETLFLDSEGNQKNGFRMTLVTADPINDGEIDKIFGASEPHSRWAIYTTPPVDRIAGIFDQLAEEEMQTIPAELRERFQSRRMPALTDEEKEGVSSDVLAIWEKYRERMDDPEADLAHAYSTLLTWLYQQRSNFNRALLIAQSETGTLREAIERVDTENEKIEADGDLEEKRRDAMEAQRDAVKKLLEGYEAEINRIELQIEKLQAMAAVLVAKIAEMQLRVVEKIEEQVVGEEVGIRR
jgi:predicted  nucleic acid-binding Zn-ribbon protein